MKLNLKRVMFLCQIRVNLKSKIEQQHSESEVNHEVENSSQQHHDDGDMNHDVDDSTHQQPLLCDSG